jgi:2'-5' RNA ligase
MRLFVAVHLGEEISRRVTACTSELREHAPQSRWSKASAAHVTLAFLGEVPEEGLEAVRAALSPLGARHRPFIVEARGGGAFGPGRRPRVLYAALQGDLAALGELKTEVERALEPLGFTPEERDFTPHITLARARDPRGDAALARCLPALSNMALGRAEIAELTLFHSKLGPNGPTHLAVHTVPLGG